MASRLTRWAGITVAGGLAAIWLLLPSGTSVLYGPPAAEPGPASRLDGRLAAVTAAKWSAIQQLGVRRDSARRERVIADAQVRGKDPVVFAEGTALQGLQPVAERTVARMWRTLPVREPGILTLFAHRDQYTRNTHLPGPGGGVCIAPVYWFDDAASLERRIPASAGACALVEQYGVPGRAWRTWIDSTPPFPYSLHALPVRDRYWFEGEVSPWYYGPGRGLVWDPHLRDLIACAHGAEPACRRAFGVGETDALGERWSLYRREFRGPLPRTLRRDLGEEGFRRLWRSDTTIAAEYAAIRGKPIDGLLVGLAQATVGPQPRDIGLSPFAWLGALIWIVLLGAWAALRLKERRIGW